MATKTVQRLDASNYQILEAIRTDASFQYQQRIPAATQGDITATVQALTDYRPMMNEFLDALVNRIGSVVYKGKTWTNPLAQFKRGMLQYGDTIEEIATTILQAKRYDPNKCYDDVFKCSRPEIMSNFHSINRQDYYEVTINDMLLKRAFTEEYGLQELVSRILETPYTSDNWDEYLIMRNLFAEYEKADGFYKIQVPDAMAATTRSEKQDKAMAITEAVRSMSMKLNFMSGQYNAAHVPTRTTKDELCLFATPEFIAMLDVNVLSFAFHMDKADFDLRVIPVDDFGIDGAQAILVDRDFFLCADTLIDFESIRNPKAISWNYWLHHHGIYSVSRFVNAIMFTTETGTNVTIPTIALTGVTAKISALPDGTTPKYAEKGGELRLEATVTGTVTPVTNGYSVPQGVVWAITGQGKSSTATPQPLSMGTFVDAEGVLHVDINEKNTDVEITATTTYIDPATPISGQTAKTAKINVGIGKAYTA